ncbi:hypothetical protein HDE_06977 [Halotydeus destructor]|nr:hypothetical protein HDE_06977 [Halotydeus destructor]
MLMSAAVYVVYALSISFFLLFVTELSIRYFNYDQLTDYVDSGDLPLRPAISICFELQILFPSTSYDHFVIPDQFRKQGLKLFGNISQSAYMRDNDTICWRLAFTEMQRHISLPNGNPIPVPHDVGLHDGNYLERGDISQRVYYHVTSFIFEAFHTVRLSRNCFAYLHSRAECWQSCVSKYSAYRPVNFPSLGDVNNYDLQAGYNATADLLCSSKCSELDCKETTYVPRKLFLVAKKEKEKVEMQFAVPLKTLIHYKLHMPLDVYILTLIAIFGLSFDISVLTVMKLIITSLLETLAKVVRYSVTVSIPLALFAQVVHISLKYYSYEASTEVYFGSPRYLTYPTLWVGHEKYKSARNFVNQSTSAKFNYYFTTATDTVSPNQLHKPLYFVHDKKMHTCWKFSETTETYMAAKTIMYSIHAKSEISSMAYLTLAWHDQAYVRFRLFSGFPNVLAPDISNISRLPAPYPSKCIHFNTEECKMKCALAAVSRFNCTLYIYPQVQRLLNSCQQAVYEPISRKCEKICETKKECLEIQYTMKSLSLSMRRIRSLVFLKRRNVTFIDVLSPQNELAITEVASLTMTSFVIYISGLFGLWFGANFNTLKLLMVNKLKGRRNFETAASSVFVLLTLAHCTFEMMTYFEYTTATLTAYETKDKLDSPKLCIRQNKFPKALGNYSAAELNEQYPSSVLESVVITSSQKHRIKYNGKNISKLNWYDMIDYYTKTSCLDMIESRLHSRILGLIVPANQIFVLEYKPQTGIYPQLLMTSRFEGSGSDNPSQYFLIETKKRILYHTIHLKLLPEPYSTSCYTYPRAKESCLNKCLRETSYRMDKRLYHSAGTHVNDSRPFLGYRTPNTEIITHICYKACKHPNCEIVGFSRDEKRYVGSTKERTFTKIHLENVVMSSIFYPIQSLYDHIVILFGILGLWLGFSVLGMLRWVELAEEIVKLRKRQPRKVKRRRAWIR